MDAAHMRRVHEALAVFLPPSDPGTSAHPQPLDRLRTRESIAELLHAAEFSDLTFAEETYRINFSGPDQFVSRLPRGHDAEFVAPGWS